MADIFEMLKEAGVEIPADKKDAFNKEFRKTYKSEGEISKVTEKLETDRDSWKQRAETAEETLKKFDGVDLETMQSELNRWKSEAENSKKEYEDKIRERDIKDKVNKRLSGVKMKDDMKDFIFEEILKTGVNLNKNGELIGFDEGLKSVQEKRPSAFVDEKQEELEAQRAKEYKPFTQPLNSGGSTKRMTREEIEAIKDPAEMQQRIAENIHLFRR